MFKFLLIGFGMVVLSGCANQPPYDEMNNKQSMDQSRNKEWKEFVAPLSTKTQSPQDRLMKRVERNY